MPAECAREPRPCEQHAREEDRVRINPAAGARLRRRSRGKERCRARLRSKNTSPFRKRLRDSRGYFPDRVWQEVKSRMLDIHDRRLALMDEHGIEMMLLSLNAPAVQAIPDPAQAAEIARKANDYLAEQVRKRPDRFQGLAALAMQDPERAARELSAASRSSAFAARWSTAFRRSATPTPWSITTCRNTGRSGRRSERLDVPFYLHPRNPLPRDAKIYEGHPLAARPDLGVRPGNGGACAAADGLGTVRRASAAADHPRPSWARTCLMRMWRDRQRQCLDREPQQLSGEEADPRIFLAKISISPRRAISTPRR